MNDIPDNLDQEEFLGDEFISLGYKNNFINHQSHKNSC